MSLLVLDADDERPVAWGAFRLGLSVSDDRDRPRIGRRGGGRQSQDGQEHHAERCEPQWHRYSLR
jgi:hypothetical protein